MTADELPPLAFEDLPAALFERDLPFARVYDALRAGARELGLLDEVDA